MESSQRTRLLVFSLFFVILIVFAVLYKPVDAMSRPAARSLDRQAVQNQ
jgi:hypothetical protein